MTNISNCRFVFLDCLFRSLLLIGLVGSYRAVAMSEVTEFWWDHQDKNWCLLTDDRMACLSETIQAARIDDKIVEFKDVTGPFHSFFIEYYSGDADHLTHAEFLEENYILRSKVFQSGIDVLEYQIDRSKDPNLETTVIVLRFDELHALVFFGHHREDIVDFAWSIVHQWQYSTSK